MAGRVRTGGVGGSLLTGSPTPAAMLAGAQISSKQKLVIPPLFGLTFLFTQGMISLRLAGFLKRGPSCLTWVTDCSNLSFHSLLRPIWTPLSSLHTLLFHLSFFFKVPVRIPQAATPSSLLSLSAFLTLSN